MRFAEKAETCNTSILGYFQQKAILKFFENFILGSFYLF